MRTLITTLALFVVVFAVNAQTDFSGKWKLNKDKSTLNEQFSMAPSEIIIVQNGNDLAMEKHASFQDTDFTINDKFTLDGIECINPGMMDTKKKSTAVFSDDKTLLTINSKMPMDDGSEMTIKETYQIVDGIMIINVSASSSWGEMSEKMAYDKQ